MAVESPAAFMQGSTFGAEITRRFIGSLFKRGGSIGTVAGGLVASGDMLVTAGSGMQVLVAPGEGIIPGHSAGQSGYYGRVTSSTALAIAASSETLPRIDVVAAKIIDKAYEGTEETFSVVALTGTPTSGATLANPVGAPSLPNSALALANVLVPAKAASIENANIGNLARVSQPGLERYAEGTAAARPAAGVKGRIYFATDTKRYSLDTGTAWEELLSVGAIGSYGAQIERASETDFEPSATRPTYVIAEFVFSATELCQVEVKVGGNLIGQPQSPKPAEAAQPCLPFPFVVPAATKWRWKALKGGMTCRSYYLPF